MKRLVLEQERRDERNLTVESFSLTIMDILSDGQFIIPTLSVMGLVVLEEYTILTLAMSIPVKAAMAPVSQELVVEWSLQAVVALVETVNSQDVHLAEDVQAAEDVGEAVAAVEQPAVEEAEEDVEVVEGVVVEDHD
jgi:hypothetical protein